MKKILTSVLAVSAIAAAAPASAQVYVGVQADPYYGYDYDGVRDGYVYRDTTYRGYGQWRGINARQNAIEHRINVGIRNGTITRSEAIRLRADLRHVSILEARYRRTGGGLSAWERRDLDMRLDRLAVRVRMERRDMDRYGFRGYFRY